MASTNTDSMAFAKNFLVGGSAGCIAKTACAPLERVKIVLQTAKTDTGLGMLGTGRKLMAEQGVAALWRGNLTNCSRYMRACEAASAKKGGRERSEH